MWLLAEGNSANPIMDLIMSLLGGGGGGGGGNMLPLILIGVFFFMFMKKQTPAPAPTPPKSDQLVVVPSPNAQQLVAELRGVGFLGLGESDMPILEWFLSLPADKQVAFVQAVMKKMQSLQK